MYTCQPTHLHEGTGDREGKKGKSTRTARVKQTCTMLHIHNEYSWGTENRDNIYCTYTYKYVYIRWQVGTGTR